MRRRRIEELEGIALSGDVKIELLRLAASISEEEQNINKLINKAGVVNEALKDLRYSAESEPPPSLDDNITIEDDWLNIFESYAANASSERLRGLWGKILSGEIRKPGSYSLTTLRVLSELDQQTASIFQKHVRGVFEKSFIVQVGELKGENLIEMTALEEVGLLQDVNGTIGLSQTFDQSGVILFRNEDLLLIARGTAGLNFRIPLIKISRSGREILSILPKESSDVCLRRIADIAAPASNTVELALYQSTTPDGRISFIPLEKIK